MASPWIELELYISVTHTIFFRNSLKMQSQDQEGEEGISFSAQYSCYRFCFWWGTASVTHQPPASCDLVWAGTLAWNQVKCRENQYLSTVTKLRWLISLGEKKVYMHKFIWTWNKNAWEGTKHTPILFCYWEAIPLAP